MRVLTLGRRQRSAGSGDDLVKPDDPGRPLRYLTYEVRQSGLRRLYGYSDISRPGADMCPFARAEFALPDEAAFRHAAALCDLDADGMSYAEFAACFERHVFHAGPASGPVRAPSTAWLELAQRLDAEPTSREKPKRAFWCRDGAGLEEAGREAARIRSAFSILDDLGIADEIATCLAHRGAGPALAMMRRMRAVTAKAATTRWTLASIAGEAVCCRGLMPVPLERGHRFERTMAAFAAEREGLPGRPPMEAVAMVHRRFAEFVAVGMPKALAQRRLSAAADYTILVGGRWIALSEAMGRAELSGYGCADLLASAMESARRIVERETAAFPDAAAWRGTFRSISGLLPRGGRYVPELAMTALAFGLAPDPAAGPDVFAVAVAATAAQGIRPLDLAAARVFDDIERLRIRTSSAEPSPVSGAA